MHQHSSILFDWTLGTQACCSDFMCLLLAVLCSSRFWSNWPRLCPWSAALGVCKVVSSLVQAALIGHLVQIILSLQCPVANCKSVLQTIAHRTTSTASKPNLPQ